jgi:hypothetical protein
MAVQNLLVAEAELSMLLYEPREACETEHWQPADSRLSQISLPLG